MMPRLGTVWLLCVVAIGCGSTGNNGPMSPPENAPSPLRVTSFNIRHSRAKDGPNAWPLRRDVFFESLNRADADLFGFQEVLADQAAEIRAALPDHGFVGVGRNDAKEDGEFSPILFRKDRFELLDGGTFWLSQTPETIGSKGWDANIPRIVTWAKLRDRRANDRTLLIANTHWDHMGKVARRGSATLMRDRLKALAGDAPVIVTGDFNCTEDDPPYAALVRADSDPKLIDAYRAIHTQRSPDESTFSAFK